MKLFKLIDLSNEDCFADDLGDDWSYTKLEDGFRVQYKEGLGGLRVKIALDVWLNQNVLTVFRILNQKENIIFSQVYSHEYDMELSQLHYGVNEKMKHIVGY